MKANGETTSSMATVRKPGLTRQYTKVIIVMAKNMARESSCGRMTVATKEILLRTTFMVSASIFGTMVVLTKVNG